MSKTKIYLIPLFIFSLFGSLFGATSVTVYNTGFNSQYLEAETTLNPVLHMKINTTGPDTIDSISVKNTIDSWGYGASAAEPGSIAGGSVKVWYAAADTANFSDAVSPQLVTTLIVSGGTTWSNNIPGGFPVADGSALWITVDFSTYPDFGVVQFQTNGLVFSSGQGNSVNEPATPSVLLVTQSTPAKNLEVSSSSGNMQPEVSTEQDGIIVARISFYNNSGTTSAPATISSISFTAIDTTPVFLNPGTIISGIKIQDADQGTTYGELSSSIPALAQPFSVPVAIDVPPASTINANVIIKISSLAAANSDFAFEILNPASVSVADSYTHSTVTVYAAGAGTFPFQSTYATIKKKAIQTNMIFDGTVIPANINKGQTNVPLASLIFTNPGDSASAYEEIYSIKISIKDSAGNPIIPHDLFSKISVVNAAGTSVTYGQKAGAAIESSGNTIIIPLPYPVPIQPAGSPASVSIKADISATSLINDFRISIESITNIQARDKNSFATIPVVPSQALPLTGSLAILSSSFKTQVTPLMPLNIYKGQVNIPVMNLTFSSPLVFGGGNIIMKGITLTVKDAGGADADFSTLFSSITIDSAHWSGVYPVSAPLSAIYFAFPDSLTLSASNLTETLNIKATLKELAPAQSVQIQLTQPADISCYQDNEPGRAIYISALQGNSFPMLSGAGYISSENSQTAFTTYPNPFRSGTSARIAYHLTQDSTVTIKIFDLTGSLIKVIESNANKISGSHEESSWDGTDKSGHRVTAGTYMARIEVKNASGSDKYSRKLTLIK
jgi:hypothetical protein